MKAAIIGYSGAGKSTLAGKLGRLYGCPVLHLDQVQFTPGWKERERAEGEAMVEAFLDENASGGWIIDGNYRKFSYERRLREADLIIFMDFPMVTCLRQILARSREYKGRTRESMAPGCPEKLDLEFLWWVVAKGRSRKRREAFRQVQRQYGEKTLVIRSHRQLKRSITKLADRSRRKSWI